MEGFIFLDLVHQRKRAIMPFVRLENVTFINDTFNFYQLNFQIKPLNQRGNNQRLCCVFLISLRDTVASAYCAFLK